MAAAIPGDASRKLIGELRRLVGRRHVLTGRSASEAYLTGYRSGTGEAVAVIRPGSLVELWRVFQACIGADHSIIPQAANTGLTGGSTPNGRYDRPVVLINTLRIRGVIPILGGEQVICLAGSTLDDLERTLAKYGREPHSVIGSSCLGASVIGGICNNSGGALVQRGPAYTEYALFARIDEQGEVHLHNELGVDLGSNPEAILRELDAGRVPASSVNCDGRPASAAGDYESIVRACDEPTPARFNADPRRLHHASGSAGKLMVFAVRLDTFPSAMKTAVFYVGTNDTAELTRLRRAFLASSAPLPVSAEYIHREASELASRYGKDVVYAIRWLGTRRLPWLFRTKAWIDRITCSFAFIPKPFSDRLLQAVSRVLPPSLPPRLAAFQKDCEHQLILQLADDSIEPGKAILEAMFPSASGAMMECTRDEAVAAMLHRFSVAGAAVRLRLICSEEVEELIALDAALRRDDRDWFETLPPAVERQLVAKLYYGHFFCHVFHQDYLVKKGCDPAALKDYLLTGLDQRGARYPAEHNVGHLYRADPGLAEHYRRLDPTNSMNPGIGKTSRNAGYR